MWVLDRKWCEVFLPDLVAAVMVRSVRIIFQDDFAVALDLNQRISGQNVVRKQSRSAVIGHRESEQAIVGGDPVAGE